MIDAHCHILPGIDDGASTMEESLNMARVLMENGFQAVFATPHLMDDKRFRNDSRKVADVLAEFQKALAGEGLDLEALIGTEVYFDRPFHDLIRFHHPICGMADSNYILVEFQVMQMPLNVDFPTFPDPDDPEELYKRIPFFRPILAHPDRYMYVLKDHKVLKDLRSKGYYFQVNLESVLGLSGKPAQKTVKKMARDGLIDLVGTDGHSADGLRRLFLKGWRKKADKILGRETAERVLETNPRRLAQKLDPVVGDY